MTASGPAALTLLALLAWAGCGGAPGEDEGDVGGRPGEEGGVRVRGDTVRVEERAARVIGLEVAVPPRDSVGEWVETTAEIAADPSRAAIVSAPAEGRVESLAAAVGDEVSRGQPLVRFASPVYLAGAVTLRAPRAGVVTAVPAAVGQVATPGTPLVEIAGLDRVLLLVDLFPEMLPRIEPGARVEFALPGDAAPRAARIERIEGRVDPVTQAARARVPLANPAGELRPGTFVRARVLADPGGEAALLPAEAVVTDSAGQWVFVPAGEGYVRRRVRARALPPERFAVVEGLAAGEPVVLRGAYQLYQAGFTFRGLATFGEEAEEEDE